jgi:hypothetical protein
VSPETGDESNPPAFAMPATPAGGGGECARLIDSGDVNADASANGWVMKELCRRFGMRSIDFVQVRPREEHGGWRGKKVVVKRGPC